MRKQLTYVFTFFSAPSYAAVRTRIGSQRLAHMRLLAGRILFAGPHVAEDGVTSLGLKLAAVFPSLETAQAWLGGDPMVRAGAYSRVVLEQCDTVATAPVDE